MTDFSRDFPSLGEQCYLNHAALCPLPAPTAEAIAALVRESARVGGRHYVRWLQREQQTRQLAAQLMQAPAAEDIALVKNTSEALSIVAHGLDWQPGDNVVIPSGEFPANRLPWTSLERRGVICREVDIRQADDPEAALLEAFDERTRLLSVSAVAWESGLRLDLERLGRHCRQRDVIFCVDAIQMLGALPVDVTAWHIDALAAGAHKWLLGPEGIGLFYIRPALRRQLRLHQFGWHMANNPFRFEQTDWIPTDSARRFEPGTVNNLGITALHASLTLLKSAGVRDVATAVLDNRQRLADGLREQGLELLSDDRPERRSGIITFAHAEADRLFEALQNDGVICARRGGGIRLSPHFYQPAEMMDEALDVIRRHR